jgi:acetyltransferase-like isoleucine patch superfamily enzyme
MDLWGKAKLRHVLRRGGSGSDEWYSTFHADGPVVIGRGTRIDIAGVHGLGAALHVGKRVVVGRCCTIRVNESVRIGSDVEIGDRVWIADSGDDDRNIWKRTMFPILIADGVRIGDRAIILPGARVDRDVASGELFAGSSGSMIGQ